MGNEVQVVGTFVPSSEPSLYRPQATGPGDPISGPPSLGHMAMKFLVPFEVICGHRTCFG